MARVEAFQVLNSWDSDTEPFSSPCFNLPVFMAVRKFKAVPHASHGAIRHILSDVTRLRTQQPSTSLDKIFPRQRLIRGAKRSHLPRVTFLTDLRSPQFPSNRWPGSADGPGIGNGLGKNAVSYE
jgi:hypothetical protein